MGQRLVVSIVRDGKPITNSYYHWSGYTLPSLEIGINVLQFIKEKRSLYSNVYELSYDALLNTGAGMNSDKDRKTAEKMTGKKYPNKEPDRNEGLINTLPETIKHAQKYSEGDFIIDIDTMEVIFNVFFIATKEDIDISDETEKNVSTMPSKFLNDKLKLEDLIDMFEFLAINDSEVFKIENNKEYFATI
jgi:hypothetical protein